MQSTAGNAAVGEYLQSGGSAPRTVQRDPVDAAEATAPGSQPSIESPSGILKYGSRGDEVKALQTRLNRVGARRPPLDVDGIFGRKTQAAVRIFQTRHPPLATDGDAGRDTMAELDRASPWTSADIDVAAVSSLFEKGRTYYVAGAFGRAYDEFTKAYEITGDWAVLWNRAQALRQAGGRRAEAIALYEQFLATSADADDQRSEARAHLEGLRGPGKSGQGPLDTALVNTLYRDGLEHYEAGRYANAYDEFSKAFEINGEAALLWNRAQALRFAGARSAEAIALYEQFIAAPDAPVEKKATAAEHIADIRGPGRKSDVAVNKQAVDDLYASGVAHFEAEEYGRAYDDFTKAHQVIDDPAMLYNRAQAMRLLGGRRAEAIALYEQFVASDIGDAQKSSANAWLAELRGPGKADAGSGGSGGGRSGGVRTQIGPQP